MRTASRSEGSPISISHRTSSTVNLEFRTATSWEAASSTSRLTRSFGANCATGVASESRADSSVDRPKSHKIDASLPPSSQPRTCRASHPGDPSDPSLPAPLTGRWKRREPHAAAGEDDQPKKVQVNGVYADWVYRGRTNFARRPQPGFRGQTSKDGKKVQVAPGYYQRANRCDSRARGSFDVPFIPGAKKFKLRSNKSFAGTGRGADSEKTVRFTWKVKGRFTSLTRAKGSITITAKAYSGGRGYLTCKARTVSWHAKAVADPTFEGW